ncbi:unnamed protein product, partial [Ectocarpus sp. 12 AP-2014]
SLLPCRSCDPHNMYNNTNTTTILRPFCLGNAHRGNLTGLHMENPLVASVEVTARLAALTDATQRLFIASVCTGWSNAWKQHLLLATSTTDPKQQPSRVDNNNGSAR